MIDGPLHADCSEFRDREDCLGRILRAWLLRMAGDRQLRTAFPDPKRVPQPHIAPDGSLPEFQQWNLTIATILRDGDRDRAFRSTRHILFARLTRRAKSPERAWEQIQTELAQRGDVRAICDIRLDYQMGVAFFHADFVRAEIYIERREPIAA